MPVLQLPSRYGDVPTYTREPSGDAPAPAVVVLHDADGMSSDLRAQADWLADASYLAAAPDLYRGGAKVRCMIRMIRDLIAGRDDAAMDAIAAARTWLLEHPRCSGKVGAIGFCMGGGFALMVAIRGEYDAASVNYGGLTDGVRAGLPKACPIVASYGGRDPTLRGAASELASLLSDADVPHDVKEYPSAGHGFMNDHSADAMPWLFVLMSKLSRTRFDPQATADARRRILAFFAEHLGGPDDAAAAAGAQT